MSDDFFDRVGADEDRYGGVKSMAVTSSSGYERSSGLNAPQVDYARLEKMHGRKPSSEETPDSPIVGFMSRRASLGGVR